MSVHLYSCTESMNISAHDTREPGSQGEFSLSTRASAAAAAASQPAAHRTDSVSASLAGTANQDDQELIISTHSSPLEENHIAAPQTLPEYAAQPAAVSPSGASANAAAARPRSPGQASAHITHSRGGAKIVKPVSSGRPDRQRASSASRARLETRSTTRPQTGRSAAPKPVRKATQQSPVKETRSTALRRAASASRLQSLAQPHSSASSTTGVLQPDWVDAKPHRPLSPRRERERQRRQEDAIAAAQARQSSRSRIPASPAAPSRTRPHRIASERAAALEAARQRPEHSFSPRITRKARVLDKQRSQSVDPARGSGPAPSQSRFHSLYDSAVAQRQRVAEKARKLACDPEATFKPAITAKARRLSRSASAEPSRSSGDVSQAAGNRLYAAARSQQRSLEAKREAAARTPGTAFRPHLNRRSLAMVGDGGPTDGSPAPGTPGRRGTPGSKRKPLYDAQALKAAQDRLEATRTKLEMSSCTFSPATNHNSKFAGRDGRPVSKGRASSRGSSRGRQQDAVPAHERLLDAGKRTAAAREAKLAAAREAEAGQPFRPTLDTKSRSLAERARRRQEAAIQAVAAARGPAGAAAAAAVDAPPLAVLSAADRAAGERAAGLAAAGLAEEAVAATNGSKAAAQHAAVILGRGNAGSGGRAPSSAFERLHSQQWLLQAKRHAAEEAARSSEEQSLAPKPSISAHSAQLAAARQEGKAQEPVWQRLYAEQWKDRSQLEAARQAQEGAKLAQCTFQPELGPDSFAHTVGAAHAAEDEAPVWQRLYADSFHAREVDAQRLAAAEERARILSTAAPRRLHAMRTEFEAATGHSVRSLADSESDAGRRGSIFDALFAQAQTRREAIEQQQRLHAHEARRLSTTVSPGGKYKRLAGQGAEQAHLQRERALAERRAAHTHALNASTLSSRGSVASGRSATRVLHSPRRAKLTPEPVLTPSPPVDESVASDDSSIAGSLPSAAPRTLLQRSAGAGPASAGSHGASNPLAAITGVLGTQSPATTPPESPTAAAQQLTGAGAASHVKAAWQPVHSSGPNAPAAHSQEDSPPTSTHSSPNSSRCSSTDADSNASPLHSQRSAAEPTAAHALAGNGSRKSRSPLSAAVLPAGRSKSYGPYSPPNSVGGRSTSAASASAALPNGPPPPLPPKRRKSALPTSPVSPSARTTSLPGTPEQVAPAHAGAPHSFPSVPPAVPAPQGTNLISPTSSSSGRVAEARSSERSRTSSSASSLWGLPPPLPPKKNKAPAPAPAPEGAPVAAHAPAPVPAPNATSQTVPEVHEAQPMEAQAPAPQQAEAQPAEATTHAVEELTQPTTAVKLPSGDAGSVEDDDISVLDDGVSEGSGEHLSPPDAGPALGEEGPSQAIASLASLEAHSDTPLDKGHAGDGVSASVWPSQALPADDHGPSVQTAAAVQAVPTSPGPDDSESAASTAVAAAGSQQQEAQS